MARALVVLGVLAGAMLAVAMVGQHSRRAKPRALPNFDWPDWDGIWTETGAMA